MRAFFTSSGTLLEDRAGKNMCVKNDHLVSCHIRCRAVSWVEMLINVTAPGWRRRVSFHRLSPASASPSSGVPGPSRTASLRGPSVGFISVAHHNNVSIEIDQLTKIKKNLYWNAKTKTDTDRKNSPYRNKFEYLSFDQVFMEPLAQHRRKARLFLERIETNTAIDTYVRVEGTGRGIILIYPPDAVQNTRFQLWTG